MLGEGDAILSQTYPKSTPCKVFPASPSVTFVVSFFAVFLGVIHLANCTKEEEFYCVRGRSEGAFQVNDTRFHLFCCVCDLRTSVTFAQIQGEVPRELPGAREIPHEK